MLDPIADKLLTSAAFISLVQLDLAPAWMVALIIGREFAITALRSLAYTKGITIPASPLGKIKMASQVTAILLLILGWGPLPWLAPIGYVALWVVMAAAVVSAVDYYRRFQRLLNARVTDVNVARAAARGLAPTSQAAIRGRHFFSARVAARRSRLTRSRRATCVTCSVARLCLHVDRHGLAELVEEVLRPASCRGRRTNCEPGSMPWSLPRSITKKSPLPKLVRRSVPTSTLP